MKRTATKRKKAKLVPSATKSTRRPGRRTLVEGFARPPLARMIKIHQLLEAQKYPNCAKLSKELNVSAKTIQRDVDFMRDHMDLPIDYENTKHGFYYTKPVDNFPRVRVTQGELVALLVAQKALEQFQGTPYHEPLESAFSKLATGLREEEGVSWDDLASNVSVRPASVVEIAHLEVFDVISQATMEQREVEFEYLKLGAKAPERRKIQPYHLSCIDNQWYVFGMDLERKKMRTFALSRASKAKIFKQKFTKPENFDLEKFLENSFSVFSGDDTENVKLVFNENVGRLVSERRWHKSQETKKLSDGSVECTFNVLITPDLERWILGWGGGVKVVSPATLKKSIQEQLQDAQAQYK